MEQDNSGMHAGLKRFSDLDGLAVADDDPDVRGWNVVGVDGQVIGEVDDLLVDTERMKVRELAVDLEDGAQISVSVERVEVDRSRREVRLTGRTEGVYAERADYTHSSAGDGISSDEARLLRSEEELRVGKQEVDAGEFVVGKQVETDRVTEPVSLKREEVEEEAAVEKRPVVKEELVVGKRTVEDTTNVEAEVRREEFRIRERRNQSSKRPRE